MKNHKNKIIAGAVIAIILALAFWCGGDVPVRNTPVQNDVSVQYNNEPTAEDTAENSIQNSTPTPTVTPIPPAGNEVSADKPLGTPAADNTQYSEENGMEINAETGKDEYQTEPVPVGKPVPVEPENTVISDKELTCTLSVRCDTILNNIGRLDKDKAALVPPDGVIFAEKTVTFYEGESVFNVLVREMKRSKIHMEFENTPLYNSAYIEGIANLYEFDCGELSGWMYRVNGWFPNYGCSRYRLRDGDKIEWIYTCDLGADIGGNYSTRNGR